MRPLRRKPSINDKKINYWTISIVWALVYGYETIPGPPPRLKGFCFGAMAIALMKSLRRKPRSIMFLGFNSLLSQQAAGNLTQERLKH